jgi:hypothetical protein
MTTYSTVFGNATVPPSAFAYRAVALTADVTLEWPDSSTGTNLVAAIMDVTATGGAWVITFPAADEVSTGRDTLVRNVGVVSFDIVNSANGAITTVAAGEAKYIYITDNSTAAGSWAVFTYGTGTSGADASALAGAGLQVVSNQLSTEFPTESTSTDKTFAAADRSKVLIYSGGTRTWYLPDPATMLDGYFIGVHNDGTGTLTIDAATYFGTIDSQSSKSIQPGESAFILTNGVEWVTLGYGRSVEFEFTQLNVDVSIGGTGGITITSAQAANKLWYFYNVSAGDRVVTIPAVASVYFVRVGAVGAGVGLTFTTGSGSTVVVSANQSYTIYCDGTNVVSAQTVAVTSSVVLDDGSAASPSLTFSLDNDTGLYRVTTNTLGITANGSMVATISPTSFAVVPPVALSSTINKLTLTAPATGATLTLADNSTLATVGAFAVTLTATGTTGVTLPTSGTLYGTASGSITSAQLAASLTDETGTGSVVFGTSPSITTPTLTNPSYSGATANGGTVTTIDINGGTIDGTVIGGTSAAAITGTTITASTQFSGPHNGTVGATTPAAGTFTTLTSTGNAALGDAEATDTHSIKGATTILSNSASAALTVTNTGSGNSFVVEDSASTDSSPLVVTNAGDLIIGATTATAVFGAKVAVEGTGVDSFYQLARYSNGAGAGGMVQVKSRGAAVGSRAAVQSGDALGQVLFYGDDGANWVYSAAIQAYVDGTPGTNDMPGRLVFSTTPDGSASPTERYRIASDGKHTTTGYVQVDNSTANAAFTITNTGSGNSFVVEDSASTDSTPFVVDNGGAVGIGGTPDYLGKAQKVLVTDGTYATIFVEGTSTTAIVSSQFSTNATGASYQLRKARGSVAVPTIVAADDDIGTISFQGYDGSANRVAATILGEVDGTPGTNDMPGRLVFSTTRDGASSPTEALRIDSTQSVYNNSTGTGTNSYGFNVSSALTGATNNYGFFSNIASGTGRWNFYANGTASNYFGGKVGVGTALLNDQFTVQAGTSSFSRATANFTAPVMDAAFLSNVTTSNVGTPQIAFISDSSARYGSIGHYRGNNSSQIGLSLFTDNGSGVQTEALRLDYLQTVAPQKLLDISASTAGQIKFPATQNASADANTLDDYEEGTWTPTYVSSSGAFGTITYDALRFGSYTKIGRTVNILGVIRTDDLPVGTATGTVRISGLPFTPAVNTPMDVGYSESFATNRPESALATTSSLINLYYRTGSTADSTTLATTDLVLTTTADKNYVIVSGTYYV